GVDVEPVADRAEDDVGLERVMELPARGGRQGRVDECRAVAGRRGGEEGGREEKVVSRFDRDQPMRSADEASPARQAFELSPDMQGRSGEAAVGQDLSVDPEGRRPGAPARMAFDRGRKRHQARCGRSGYPASTARPASMAMKALMRSPGRK